MQMFLTDITNFISDQFEHPFYYEIIEALPELEESKTWYGRFPRIYEETLLTVISAKADVTIQKSVIRRQYDK